MNTTTEVRMWGPAPAGAVPILVVATTLAGTREALVAATRRAEATRARVCVIVQTGISGVVSKTAATEAAQAFADHVRRLPEASSSNVAVVAMLGRRPTDLIPLLPPGASVFIGGASGRWWPRPAQRTANAFARHGCRVFFVHAAGTPSGGTWNATTPATAETEIPPEGTTASEAPGAGSPARTRKPVRVV